MKTGNSDSSAKGLSTIYSGFDYKADIIKAAATEKMRITGEAILAGCQPDQKALDSIDEKAGYAKTAVTLTERAILRLKDTVGLQIFDDRAQAAFEAAVKCDKPIEDEHAFCEKVRETMMGTLASRQAGNRTTPAPRKVKAADAGNYRW